MKGRFTNIKKTADGCFHEEISEETKRAETEKSSLPFFTHFPFPNPERDKGNPMKPQRGRRELAEVQNRNGEADHDSTFSHSRFPA